MEVDFGRAILQKSEKPCRYKLGPSAGEKITVLKDEFFIGPGRELVA